MPESPLQRSYGRFVKYKMFPLSKRKQITYLSSHLTFNFLLKFKF